MKRVTVCKQNCASLFVALLFLVSLLMICSNAAANQLFWTDSGTSKIQCANLDGSNVQDWRTEHLIWPHGIDIDYATGDIFWVESNNPTYGMGVYKSNINNPANFSLFAPVTSPRDVALDTVNQKFYVTRVPYGGIWVNDANQGDVTYPDTFNDSYHYRNVAVDPINGKVYFTVYGSSGFPNAMKIGRANLDGSNEQGIYYHPSLLISEPQGIAIDPFAGKMYWTDFIQPEGYSVRRANLDGSDLEVLFAPGYDQLGDLALDINNGKIYWTNTNRGEIWWSNFDGSDPQAIVTGLVNPKGIALNVPIPEPAGLCLILLSTTAALRRRTI